MSAARRGHTTMTLCVGALATSATANVTCTAAHQESILRNEHIRLHALIDDDFGTECYGPSMHTCTHSKRGAQKECMQRTCSAKALAKYLQMVATTPRVPLSAAWLNTTSLRTGKHAFVGIDYLDFLVYAMLLRHLPSSSGRTPVFFEAGASDGLYGSNTWFLEAFAGWTGLLVEPDPCGACHLPLNRPHARIFSGGICPKPTTLASLPAFTPACTRSAASTDSEQLRHCVARALNRTAVPCKPISQLLREAQLERIDFFSLDVQHLELKALQSIDFNSVDISSMLVECWSLRCERLLREKGFSTLRLTNGADGLRKYVADVLAWKPSAWRGLCQMSRKGVATSKKRRRAP